MALIEVTPAANEPITTAEAKTHMRVDESDEDTYIGTLITAARKWCESYTNRSFYNTTWRQTWDDWPGACDNYSLRPWRSPLGSVSTLKYYDTDGVLQTMSSSDYTVDTDTDPGRVSVAYGDSWPSIRPIDNAIQLTYVAGYGASASSIPEDIRHAIKMLVAHWFEAREPIVVGTSVSPVPMTVEALLSTYRIMEFV